MKKSIGILILLGALAGCSSVDTGQTSSLRPTAMSATGSPQTSCGGKPWSWCAGYHGDR
jgi:hypothetical protein